MNEQKRDEFEEKIRPVMKWLNKNKHPHVKVIITPTNTELIEGEYSTVTIMDYVKN